MQQSGLPYLSDWQNFAMLTGTAAATLTGLMFVVTTLIAGIEHRVETLNAGISAFNTPTVAHFCAVLVLAGILSAPWQTYTSPALLLGLLGLGGVVYLIIIMQRMRHVPDYKPHLRDWLWYFAIPFLAYLVLVTAAGLLAASPSLALFTIAAVMLVLLSTGIHNAWDLVTFLAVERSHPANTSVDHPDRNTNNE